MLGNYKNTSLVEKDLVNFLLLPLDTWDTLKSNSSYFHSYIFKRKQLFYLSSSEVKDFSFDGDNTLSKILFELFNIVSLMPSFEDTSNE